MCAQSASSMSSVGTRFVVPATHDEDVDLAELARHASRSRSSDRDVARRPPASAASGGRAPRSSAATSSTSVCAPAGGDDVRAGVGQPERQRAADAARAADDDGQSAGQIENGRDSGRRLRSGARHMSEAIIRQGQCLRMG